MKVVDAIWQLICYLFWPQFDYARCKLWTDKGRHNSYADGGPKGDPPAKCISTFLCLYPSQIVTNIAKNMPFFTILASKFAYVRKSRKANRQVRNVDYDVVIMLVEQSGCDIRAAIRFFYNSDFYASLPEGDVDGDLDEMFERLKKEFTQG